MRLAKMEPDLFGRGKEPAALAKGERSHGSVFNLTFNSFHSRLTGDSDDGRTASLDRPELLRCAHVLLAGAVGARQTHTLVVRRLRLARGGLK